MSNPRKLILAAVVVAIAAAASIYTKPGRIVLAKLGIAVACEGSCE